MQFLLHVIATLYAVFLLVVAELNDFCTKSPKDKFMLQGGESD